MVVATDAKSMEVNETEDRPVVRKEAKYEFIGREKLLVKSYQPNLQYVHIYATRLNSLRPKVNKAMQHRISENLLNSSSLSSTSRGSPSKQHEGGADGNVPRVPLVSISAIRPDRKYAVIGTLQKRQTLKPSILKEVSEEHNLEPPVIRDTFVDKSDQIFIEDDTQSLALTGNIDTQRMVVGAIGKENSDGEFQVDEIFYPHNSELISNSPAMDSEKSGDEGDSFVMFVSGLNVGGDYESVLLDMLASFVSGDCGPMSEISSKIVRVIVCGNSIDSKCVDKELHTQALYLSKKSTLSSVLPLQTLDCTLQQMCSSCNVDVMAGETDPCTAFLPQQPMNRCMFPKSRVYSTFATVTNPYHCKIDDSIIVGCSGQNLKDIGRYSTVTDELAALEMTLKSQITCPTAPDTLPCYPLGKSKEDPFIIDPQPRVYFAGNCSELQYKLLNNETQLILCVPTFSKTKEAVLVNLKDLKVTPVCFSDVLMC